MNTFRPYLSTFLVFVIGIALGIGGILFSQYIKGPKQTVKVVGQGVVEALADQAIINVQLSNTSWSKQVAQDATKKDAIDLKNTLLRLGIPTSQISENMYDNTSQMSPAYTPDEFRTSSKIMPPIRDMNEYVSTLEMNITLSTLSGIDNILSAIAAQKNAQITYSEYSLKSPVKFEESAREKALLNARSQVESIAKINKLRVGKLVSISDTSSIIGNERVNDMMMSTSPQVGANPITYGEKTIPVTASFNAVYELY